MRSALPRSRSARSNCRLQRNRSRLIEMPLILPLAICKEKRSPQKNSGQHERRRNAHRIAPYKFSKPVSASISSRNNRTRLPGYLPECPLEIALRINSGAAAPCAVLSNDRVEIAAQLLLQPLSRELALSFLCRDDLPTSAWPEERRSGRSSVRIIAPPTRLHLADRLPDCFGRTASSVAYGILPVSQWP